MLPIVFLNSTQIGGKKNVCKTIIELANKTFVVVHLVTALGCMLIIRFVFLKGLEGGRRIAI